MLIATYDIGTTAVKGVLIDDRGTVISSASENIDTIYRGDDKEQDPARWWEVFCRISREFAALSPGGHVDGIVMSGQMQDVIPVRKDGRPAGNAILYSDGRAEEEARELMSDPGTGYLESISGNHYDGSLSLPKIMWLKRHCPDVYAAAEHFLISAKDYIILKLTGVPAGDIVACSTAGAMDIRKKIWDGRILGAAGIPAAKMPALYKPHEIVGVLNEEAAAQTGFAAGTKVYAGTGDAGATTLASGIARKAEYNINLGTSGWVATVSDEISRVDGGIFNLAAMQDGLYINVVPFLNAGNVHEWISGILTGRDGAIDIEVTGAGADAAVVDIALTGADAAVAGIAPAGTAGSVGIAAVDYAAASAILKNHTPGSNGVTFLPYLNGERFPVMDAAVKGAFLGITATTARADLLGSCLEGVAFSIRQGIESIGIPPEKVSVIGGGSREPVWNQILADVLHQEVLVFKNPDTLPALALGSSVLLGEGRITSYSDFTETLRRGEYSTTYKPDPGHTALYDEIYKKYTGIYPMIKAYYRPAFS